MYFRQFARHIVINYILYIFLGFPIQLHVLCPHSLPNSSFHASLFLLDTSRSDALFLPETGGFFCALLNAESFLSLH